MTTQTKIDHLKKLLIYQKEILAAENIVKDSEKRLQKFPDDELVHYWMQSAKRRIEGYTRDYENVLLLLTEEKESVL